MTKLFYNGRAYATYFKLFYYQKMSLTKVSIFHLLNSGFDINAVDEEGQTLLIYSLRSL